jgi:flagellar P-ring protein precursor FlgI
MEEDWIHDYVAIGKELSPVRNASPTRSLGWIQPEESYTTLVLEDAHAEWGVSYAIAQAINQDAAIPTMNEARANQLAMAFDPRTVIIHIPQAEKDNLAQFMARIERIQLEMPATEARVRISRSTGNIFITGDVEISPVVISCNGLTISTMVPEPKPTPENPLITEKNFIALDPQKKGETKLADLVDALNQIRVPAKDRINIIETLKETGKLHAELIVDK